MSKASFTDRPVIVVRIMALVTVVLALLCVGLAWAWQSERQQAACWRTAAEFQLQPDAACSG
ncbi:hypothetical protein [Phenylobacterium sp.]|uniref:hypothetical protein n=1 Tax=Phenylobacterium sp. TaxID=1871053 RepID=UPI0025E1947A|nr:hypothetical protein [Phenylobacterium sp.]